MLTGLIAFHVILCVFITLVVLLQFGKGAEAGAMMGSSSGASQNIFSTSSKGNVVTKATNVMAILFIVNSLLLNKMMSKESKASIMDDEAKVIQLQREDAKTPESAIKENVKAKAVEAEAVTTTTLKK